MSHFCEIPIVSATTLDQTLTASGSGRAAIQKYRQQMRRNLDPGMRISVGRAGTLQLISVAALACVATATRWNMKNARKLAGIYKKAGFGHLTRSKHYKSAMGMVGQAVRARVQNPETKAAKTALMEIIPGCWEELTCEQEVVRSVTRSMHDIFVKVDREVGEMRRFPGRLVRFEGENALITIDNGEREELRSVDGAYLKSAGICRNGAPFVLHEYRWSPDTTMSVYFPALDLDSDPATEAELAARLKGHEKPLPEPPAGLLPVDFVPKASGRKAGHTRPATGGGTTKTRQKAKPARAPLR